LQVKHLIAVSFFISVNFSGFYIQRNVLGFCNFMFV